MKKSKLKIPMIILIAAILIGTGGYIAYSYMASNKFTPDISDVREAKANKIDFTDQTENVGNSSKNDEGTDNVTDGNGENSLSDNKSSNRGIYIDSRSSRILISQNGAASGAVGINGIINGITRIPSNDSSNSANQGNGSTGGVSADGDDNVIFPALNPLTEPKKSTPKDAYDSLGIPIPEYKANDPDNNSRIMTLDVSLAYNDMFDNSEISIYDGEILTQENLLCRVYAYASDGTTAYRIKELSNNFYIKDYPKKAYNNFSATFCFRTTSLSPWQEVTLTIPTVPRKLLLITYQNGIYANATQRYSDLYPDYNEKINLYKYYYILGDNGTKIDRLFRGWSETENGTPIGETYTAQKSGLIYLYPTGFTPLPKGITAQIKERMLSYELEFLQTIVDCDSKITALDVPKYISFIQFSKLNTFDEINLSETVKYFDFENTSGERTVEVKKRYSVNKNNPYFTSVDGMLLSKDKSVIYDIPSSVKSADIPKTVTEINLSAFNTNLKEIILHGENVPSVNLSAINNAVIYVPKEAYLDYLSAYGSSLGTNELLPDGNSVPEYIYIGGAILSDYGKTLYSIDENALGTVIVPSSVENVASGATDSNKNIDTIIFDKNLKHLEENAINTDCISRVFILSENAIDVENGAFYSASGENEALSDGISVCVQKSAYDNTLSIWSEFYDDIVIKAVLRPDSLSLENENDFELLSTNRGSIILDAPKDLDEFNSSTLTKSIYEISSRAFKGSDKLRYVDLGESVKIIGAEAFAECKNLEGVYSTSTDEINVKNKALYNDKKLKYGVFNALYGNFADDFQNINIQVFFAPYNTYGYGADKVIDYFSYFVDYNSDGYKIESINENERIIYAWCDYVSSTGAGYVLCAATTGVSGKITLPESTRMIQDYAFANCKNEFELENYEDLELISSYSFVGSGLSGDYDFTNLHFVLEGGFASCRYLKNIKFPVLQMGTNIMLADCTSLETVEFGSTLESIWSGSLSGCDKLQKIVFSSKEPISLEGVFGYDFTFAGEASPDEVSFKIILSGEANAEEYIKEWRCTLLGWPLEYIDMISDEELARGEENARKYLGVYKKRTKSIPTAVPDEKSQGKTEEEQWL